MVQFILLKKKNYLRRVKLKKLIMDKLFENMPNKDLEHLAKNINEFTRYMLDVAHFNLEIAKVKAYEQYKIDLPVSSYYTDAMQDESDDDGTTMDSDFTDDNVFDDETNQSEHNFNISNQYENDNSNNNNYQYQNDSLNNMNNNLNNLNNVNNTNNVNNNSCPYQNQTGGNMANCQYNSAKQNLKHKFDDAMGNDSDASHKFYIDVKYSKLNNDNMERENKFNKEPKEEFV